MTGDGNTRGHADQPGDAMKISDQTILDADDAIGDWFSGIASLPVDGDRIARINETLVALEKDSIRILGMPGDGQPGRR